MFSIQDYTVYILANLNIIPSKGAINNMQAYPSFSDPKANLQIL